MIKNGLKYNRHCQWSRADILDLSLRLFRRTVISAYLRSPFYRDFYASLGIRYRDLSRLDPSDLPVIGKETIRHNSDRIATVPVYQKAGPEGDNQIRLFPGSGYPVHTSGSTGKPCSFLYSRSAVSALESNFVRLSIAGGESRITISDFPIKSLHISSVGRGYASMLLAQNGLKSYHAKSIIVDASTPLEEWPDKIADFSPSYLSGYPSCIHIAAGLQQAGKLRISPKKIISGGEPMGKEEMRRLSKLFGADVINYYGCTESILIGAGASWYDGIYLFDDLNFLETDSRNRLIITPLANRAFPLIRYQLDDIVEGFSKEFVPPLPFTHIDRVAGRTEELMWFENEKRRTDFLHPLFLDDLDVEGIEKYQFEQIGRTAFLIRCIASTGNAAELEKNIRRQIDGMLRGKAMTNVKYRVEFVDRIAPDPVSGKIKLVIKMETESL